jgi:starch synthase
VDKCWKNYSIENFEKGKQQNKGYVNLFNLDPTKPLYFISSDY